MPVNNVATTPSRAGQSLGAGSDLALFLKKFAGEVLTTFTTDNIFSQMHTMRTIENGKSAQFPLTGYATAAYHTPGYDILDSGNSLLSNILHDEKVINIDSLLLSSVFVPNIDEMMNHYDVRSIYSTELGRALAKKFDQNVAKVIALSATGTSAVTSGGKVTGFKITNKGSGYTNGGTITFSSGGGSGAAATIVVSGGAIVGINLTNPGSGYTSAPTVGLPAGSGGAVTAIITNERAGSSVTLTNTSGSEPSASQLLDGLYQAAQVLDEKNIPSEDRFCVIAPEQYYLLGRSSTDLFNRFYGNNTGNYNSVQIPEVAGFKVFRSNNLPKFSTGTAAGTGENNTYYGDFTLLRALCFHKAAAGTVKLRDISVESEYKIERQGTLFVSKYAMGHGALRPEAAVVVNRIA